MNLSSNKILELMIKISSDKELYLTQLKHPREWSNCSKDSYKLYEYENGWSTYNLK